MTTSKILVPAGTNLDGTKDRVPVDIEIPQPLHVVIDTELMDSYRGWIEKGIYATSVIIPDGTTIIGENVFSNYSKLADINIPSSVKEIKKNAFSNCPLLTSQSIGTLPDGLERIEAKAFYMCKGLTTMTFPASLKYIGVNAFQSCTGLNVVTFEGTPETIIPTAFNGCTNIRTINVPWSEGEVENAPWGATNATIHYDS